MVPAVALVAALWLPFGAATHALLRNPDRRRRGAAAVVVLPAVWVLTEVVRSVPVLAGTWGILGLTQAPVPEVLGVAALGGVWLLSAVLVATNTAIAMCVVHLMGENRRPLRAAGAALTAAALVGSSLAAGVFLAAPDGTRVLRVTGVQPGKVDDGGARLDANLALTNTIAPGSADVIVWGQSSVAFDLDTDTDVTKRLEATADRLGTDLLVNTDARSPGGRITKTSVLIRPGAGASERYAKQRLVPFGEYIPARPLFGWLERFTDAADEDRLPGADVVVMDLGAARVGPLVSYESTFPDLRRTVTRAGADVVVVQAASTTFQGSWAQPQQAWGEAVRAAESGRATVMVAVSGTSAAFDTRGGRLAWLSAGDTGTFDVALPVATATTPYVRFGDWVVVLAVAVVAITGSVPVARRITRQRATGGQTSGAGA
jgi:apolipoprotein N-acyltransferase